MSLPRSILALLLCVASGGAAAQASAPAAPTREAPPERLQAAQQRLKLTPDQAARLEPLFREEADKLRTIQSRYGNDTSPAARRARLQEMQGVQQDLRARVAGVLDARQMAEWDRMRQEEMEKLRVRRQETQ